MSRARATDFGDVALGMRDGWSRARAGIPANDPWLDQFNADLEAHRDLPMLDLGCGTGADTLWLLERGYDVLSADYSRRGDRARNAYPWVRVLTYATQRALGRRAT